MREYSVFVLPPAVQAQEQNLNQLASEGWRPISITCYINRQTQNPVFYAYLEREKSE